MIRGLALLMLLAWVSSAAAQPATFEQQSFRDLPYYDGPDAHSVRHKLDIHVPKGHKDFPVVFFVHGGGWIKGNKDHLGIYTILARAFNRHGIGVVCPNYRLSPDVRHPEHIRDVARAFAWTYKNIHKFGGKSDELFVSGHSAGGHLCALLATDEQYLKAHGLTFKAIKGAMPISGVFIIPEEPVFDVPFGKDRALRKQASPITFARPGLPPFLVMFGDNDLPSCDRAGAEAFCKAMAGKEARAELLEVQRRNHLSILWSAIEETDPVTQSMLSFIMSQVVVERLGRPETVGEFGDYLSRYVGHVARTPRKKGL